MKRCLTVLALALVLMLMPWSSSYSWRGPVLAEPDTEAHPWGGEESYNDGGTGGPTSVAISPIWTRADAFGVGAWFYQYAYRTWGWFRPDVMPRTVQTKRLVSGQTQGDSTK